MANVPAKSPYTVKELEIIANYEATGIKPLAGTLVAQLYQLFLESYSCAQIAELNKSKGLTEADVLYASKKYHWHSNRDRYAFNLQNQIQQKIAKAELEMVEHVTNMLSVTHKHEREQMLKYMQTGAEEDKPSNMPTTLKQYKDLIDLMQKITGKDKITKHEVKTENKTTFSIDEATRKSLSAEDQMKLLANMVSEQEGKKS